MSRLASWFDLNWFACFWKKDLPCQTLAALAATDRPRSFFPPQQHIVGLLNSSICCDYVQMAFICHPFQSCSAALWLEADDADQITAGLLPEKDTRTIGFVKYSLQCNAIILTFVGVSLYVSGASFVSRLHLWCWKGVGGLKILYSPLVLSLQYQGNWFFCVYLIFCLQYFFIAFLFNLVLFYCQTLARLSRYTCSFTLNIYFSFQSGCFKMS